MSSDYKEINSSPVNNSTSKQMYSFSRAKRFPNLMKYCCTRSYYDLPDTKMRRTTSFGKANRNTGSSSNLSFQPPPPGSYDPIEALKRITSSRAFSFGTSKEGSEQCEIKKISSSPGPGAYSTYSLLGKEGRHYTIKPKAKNLSFINTRERSPGPGAYEALPCISAVGKYSNSNFQNSKAAIFNPPRSQRFSSVQRGTRLGPGQYNPNLGISNKGTYVISNFQNSLASRFGRSQRNHRTPIEQALSMNPGPGSYRPPSEFGYYEKVVPKTYSPVRSQRNINSNASLH